MTLAARLAALRDEEGDTRALAVARVGLGLLLLHQAVRAARDLAAGPFFGDTLHLSTLPEALVVSRPVYTCLVAALLALAPLVVLGRWARPALLASALAHLYLLLVDRIDYHHHRYALALFAALVAFTPCDRLLVARRRPAAARGPLWAQHLARVQVSLLYLASGGSKLLDDDWRAGRVIADGIARFGPLAVARGAPATWVWALGRPSASAALAAATIATELLLAVALWVPRLRAVALWWGLWFHVAIHVTTSVSIFSALMICVYALFTRPDAGARALRYDPARRWHRRLAACILALDWLDRLRPVAAPGARFAIVDRDGRPAEGAAAAAAVARVLPLVFPAWLPLHVATRVALPGRAGSPRPTSAAGAP